MTAEATRLYLVRHGRVAHPWPERIYGDLDVPLSEAGRAQARAVGRAFRSHGLDAVVSSGLERAEYGAACLREGRALPRIDRPALRELHRGAWAGVAFAELEQREPGAWSAWHADPIHRRPPDGENLAELEARVVPALQALVEEYAGGAVAVVAHSWVCRLAACRALSLSLDHCAKLDCPPASVLALDWSGASDAHPVLAGFGVTEPPERRAAWFRGPSR